MIQSAGDASQTAAEITVYTPQSSFVQPIKLIKLILADVWRYRELTWILFLRDLKSQYRQSYFGYLWVFAPIAATTLTWMFLNSSQIIQVSTPGTPYPIFVLVGTLIWSSFAMSVVQPTSSFALSKDVFTKLNVPVEAFILAGFGNVIFNVLLQASFLVPVFFYFSQPLAATAWLFPIGLGCSVLIGMSIGLAALPVAALYSDVTRAMTVLLSFFMLLSPVVYPPPQFGVASIVMKWNPMTPVLIATRDSLTIGMSSHVLSMSLVTLVSIFLLGFGLVAMRIAMPRVVERMGM